MIKSLIIGIIYLKIPNNLWILITSYEVQVVDFMNIIKVELYPDSGKISRVRFLRPTGLSEMDKLISEDVSRLSFEFEKDNVEPNQFKIEYLILLRNRLSREEAKAFLQKKVKK